ENDPSRPPWTNPSLPSRPGTPQPSICKRKKECVELIDFYTSAIEYIKASQCHLQGKRPTDCQTDCHLDHIYNEHEQRLSDYTRLLDLTPPSPTDGTTKQLQVPATTLTQAQTAQRQIHPQPQPINTNNDCMNLITQTLNQTIQALSLLVQQIGVMTTAQNTPNPAAIKKSREELKKEIRLKRIDIASDSDYKVCEVGASSTICAATTVHSCISGRLQCGAQPAMDSLMSRSKAVSTVAELRQSAIPLATNDIVLTLKSAFALGINRGSGICYYHRRYKERAWSTLLLVFAANNTKIQPMVWSIRRTEHGSEATLLSGLS
ncbi:hypothetical protein TNCV_1136071, partial [Trichonephila clavipes]